MVQSSREGRSLLPKSSFPSVMRLQNELVSTHFYQISMASCIQVGIALAVDHCSGACPQPQSQLGDVLYAGPWNPVTPKPGYGYIQNFTVKVSQSMAQGPAIFTLTHLCLLGVGDMLNLRHNPLKTRRRAQHHFLNTGVLPSKSNESKGVTDQILGESLSVWMCTW